MTVSSGFFDSVNHDRLYNADQVSSMFDGLILDGVYENMGDAFAINAYPDAENTVIVGTGRAWFDHTWTLNDTQYALTLDPPSDSMSRIDAIVLDVDKTLEVRNNTIKLIKGTPVFTGETAQKPTLIKEDLHNQYPLAYVTRSAGASATINQADIEYMVGTDECPMVIGLLEAINIEQVYAQLKDEFYLWWDGVILGDPDMATHLQEQIDELKTRFGTGLLTPTVYDMFKTGQYDINVKSFNIPTGRPGGSNSKLVYYNGIFYCPDGKITNFYFDSSDILHVDLYNLDGVKVQTASMSIEPSYRSQRNGSVYSYKVDEYPCKFILAGSGNYAWSNPPEHPDWSYGYYFIPWAITVTITADGVITFGTLNYKMSSLVEGYSTMYGADLSFDNDVYVSLMAYQLDADSSDGLHKPMTCRAMVAKVTDGVVGNIVDNDNAYSSGDVSYTIPMKRITKDTNTGKYVALHNEISDRHMVIDPSTLKITVETGDFTNYPYSNNLTNFSSDVKAKLYYLSESKGFYYKIGDEETKISYYFTGASNSGDGLPEGLYNCYKVDDATYVGVMSDGTQIAIGDNGAAAILKAKKTSASVDASKPIMAWRNCGYVESPGYTITVRQTVTNDGEKVLPATKYSAATVTVVSN